jgi:hypothetical protein
MFVLILAGSAAVARDIDEYDLFSSLTVKELEVKGADDAKDDPLLRGNINALINFTLGSGNNGIAPSGDDVTIEFGTTNMADDQHQRFKIFIPAHSFVKKNLWYEIYEPDKPSDIGIKVFSIDNITLKATEDISDSLIFFEAILTSKDESHYLFIEAIFEQKNLNVLIPVSINSSTQLLLAIGDDAGTTF